MILQRTLVLEVGATDAEPQLPAILLVGAPISAHGERFPAAPASEWASPVLALVVGLKGSEVLERTRAWVADVVLATFGAAIAWKPHHGRRSYLRRCAAERIGASSVL